jgi:hypothetical protein
MGAPVLDVLLGDRGIVDQNQILGVVLLRRLREIEAASYHRLAVNDHNLVVCNRVLRVDQYGHIGVFKKRRAGVTPARVALVQDDADIDTAFPGINDGFCDWRRSETIRLNENLMLCRVESLDESLRWVAAVSKRRAETDLDFIGSRPARSERKNKY